MDEKKWVILMDLRGIIVRLADIACLMQDSYPDHAQKLAGMATFADLIADEIRNELTEDESGMV